MSGVQSVERALQLLHEIATDPCSSSELARRTGLPTSTAARLLGTLADHGTVIRDSAGHYRIGPSIVAMAASSDPTHGLVEVATRTLLDLANDTGESASLGIPLGNEMQYVAQMNTAHSVQIRDWVGTRAPVHGGAPGLVILASWSNDRIDEYLGRRLLPMTKANVVDPEAIRRRVEHVRQSGFIWTHEEGADGISVVAAPVRNSSGTVVASLQAWGPSYRFPAKGRERLVAGQVMGAAQRVSSMLGYRRRTTEPKPAI